jgi:hypothetical protein
MEEISPDFLFVRKYRGPASLARVLSVRFKPLHRQGIDPARRLQESLLFRTAFAANSA